MADLCGCVLCFVAASYCDIAEMRRRQLHVWCVQWTMHWILCLFNYNYCDKRVWFASRVGACLCHKMELFWLHIRRKYYHLHHYLHICSFGFVRRQLRRLVNRTSSTRVKHLFFEKIKHKDLLICSTKKLHQD